jgi:hypothetical protein
MADTYRAWLQSQPNKSWALDYVGDDYDSANAGINTSKLFEAYGGQDQANSAGQTLRNYANEYGAYRTGNTTGGSTLGASTGGGSGAEVDPNAIALYDQGIGQTNSALGRLLNQENVGRSNILGDWQTGRNQLNQTKARTEADYEQNKVKTTKDNVTAKSNIDFATGQQANSLQRLLGQRGAGSSSASRVAAPYAAALQGTQQRTQVNDAFAENMGGLDKSFGLFNEDWNSAVTDLDAQKKRNEDSLVADILGKRTSLLQTLASLQTQKAQAQGGNPAAVAQPYLDQINQIAPQIDNLGAKYQGTVAAKAPTYKAPDLAKYDYDKAAPAQFGQQGGALADSISPYLSLLLKGKDKQQLATY